MKKLLIIIFALVIIFSMSATAFAADGSTTVDVTVDSSQISVEVPVDVSIVAKVDGGAAVVPNNYKITNSSAIPVKVDTIAVTLKNNTDWAFKDILIEAKTAPTSPGINDIYLSVNGQVLKIQGATAPPTPASWNISAGGELPLPIVCSTSKLDQTGNEEDLITITYVISAGSH